MFLTQVQSTLVSVSLSDSVLTMSLSSIEEDGTKKLQSSNVQWPETEGPPEQVSVYEHIHVLCFYKPRCCNL